ncbi:pilus assembly protein TadF [Vibrio diazotrophicus]|uniref:Pilus assembly protein TadF n=1 Tax=Vibrio diazotrophicus TaxID=685 RepID=A0A2J8I4V9_VIBDI|nr:MULTISPECIES: tight adherence pilus pseudopilin TadF [Vibrio]MCF7361903.1 pilus assembly protein TadF [Vibrio sp. A1-b2]PNI05553.1 pilus assembly protein TadF [Vibrio diazotrophicus]
MLKKQQGVFIVEFLIVLVLATSLTVVVANHMLVLNQKGQLNRTSYSLATIVSERSLFDSELRLCGSAMQCLAFVDTVHSIAVSTLNRTMGNFEVNKLGVRLSEVRLDSVSGGTEDFSLVSNTYDRGPLAGCSFGSLSNTTKRDALELLPFYNGQYMPLYKVSLCYEVPMDLIGGVSTGELFHISSTSLSFARL